MKRLRLRLARLAAVPVFVIALLAVSATAALAAFAPVDIGGSGTSAACSTQYHIVINGVSGTPPPVRVTFSNGQIYTFTGASDVSGGGNVAHYRLSPTTAIPVGLTITKVEVDGGSYTGNVRVSNLACAPVVPEVPLAAVYPVVGFVTFGAGYLLRKRRRSDAVAA